MKEIINLPFGESLKRTCLYLVAHFNRVWQLMLIGVVIMTAIDVVLSFPSQCKEGEQCLGWKSNLNVLAAALTAVSVSVAFMRQIILKVVPAGFPISFGKREIKFLFYNLMILLIILAIAFVCGIVYSLLLGDARALQKPTALLPFLLIILMIAVVLSRLCLVLPAIAADNNDLTFAKAFDMTKGNSNKIFFGMFLTSLPVSVVTLFAGTILQTMTIESWTAKLLISAFMSSLSLLNALIKACYLAHIYQYFTYFYKPEKAESQSVKSLLD